MKPQRRNIKILLTISWISFLTISCKQEIEPASKNEMPKGKTIILDAVPVGSTMKELDATTEELSGYDCDLNWILFDYNSSRLTNEAKFELEKVAMIIAENSTFKARLRAFTDSKGSPEYNQKLSKSRASSAKKYLIAEGVPENNISIDGYAEARPIARNTEDDTGRRYNRRIELYVLDKLNNTVCRSHPPSIPKELKVN